MLDRKLAPPILDAVDFDLKLKPCERFTLDNHTPVYAINAGAEDVVSVELIFAAGAGLESKNLMAIATNQLLKSGTPSKTAFEISEAFDFYGAYLTTGCASEMASVSVSCLSKHLPALLPLVAALITDSIFPQKEIDIYIKNRKQRLEMDMQKSDFVAGRLIDAYLYGEAHPYGKYTQAKDLDALTQNDLIDFYKKYYTQGSCKIFVAGKFSYDMQQQLNAAFGHLPFVNDEHLLQQIDYTHHAAKEKKYTIINDPKSVQGAIRLGREMPNRHSPDWSKVQVLNTVFGGYFGSRLMSNIREDKGYTYGIHSYMQGHIHESALIIATDAGRDVCAATIEEVWKEAALLREELIGGDELKLVKNYLIGSILGSLDGPFQMIGRWKSYILNGFDENYFYKNIDTIKNVTPGELRDLANKYLVEDVFYQLTVF